MTKHDTAAWEAIRPALDALRGACEVARHLTPGGRLLEHDLVGIRRRVARKFGVTPEDLARWDALDRQRLAQRGSRRRAA